MQRVALIDYGSGNLRSAEKALVRAAEGRAEIVVTHDPDVVAVADRVVLPGVGAFAACMSALEARAGVIEAMTEAVRGRGAPFLGICVGMQLMASRGHEFGVTEGWRESTAISFVKLVLHPLAVWSLAYLLRLPPLETRAVVLLASLPVGANVYLMAREFNSLPGPVAASLVLSCAAAAVTTPLVLVMMTG